MKKTARQFDPRQVMHRPDFEIFHYHDPKMREVPLHHHDFYEVYYFLSGKVDYLVEGRTYTLLPEDVLLISPMELHRPAVAPDRAYERIVLWIDPAYLDSVSGGDDAPRRIFGTGRNLYHGGHTEIGALMRRLARESASDQPGSALSARGLFLQLMAELVRLSAADEASPAPRDDDSLVDRVLAYIGEHYPEPLDLDSLSSVFYVDKYHLSHLFSRSMGVSVYRYVILKRLQHARQMLSEGLSPGEACRSCGFQDYANFYRAFRSVYGIGPQAAAERETAERPSSR